MTKDAEHLNSAEPSPKSPIERFDDMLEGLESFLEGQQKIGLRNTPILQTVDGDIRFSVYLPDPASMYSQSITCQRMVKSHASEGEFMAPASKIHLKLRHLDGSLGPPRDEDINAAQQKLQGLEQALAVYEAAALKISEASSSTRRPSRFLAGILRIAGRSHEN